MIRYYRLSIFSSNKKLGVIAGVAAVIAIIVIVGFTATDFTSNSILSKSILVNVDKTTYQRADIISITGNVKSNTENMVEVFIKNANGKKIWNEYIHPKSNGDFSTLLIAGGNDWNSNGKYILTAQHVDVKNTLEFSFSV